MLRMRGNLVPFKIWKASIGTVTICECKCRLGQCSLSYFITEL